MKYKYFNGGVLRAQWASRMEFFAKLVNGLKWLTVFCKGRCLGLLLGSGLTNNFLFYTLECPFKDCLETSFGRGYLGN